MLVCAAARHLPIEPMATTSMGQPLGGTLRSRFP
jgi:hypothetical protein